MCDHQGQECPGNACQCVCPGCQFPDGYTGKPLGPVLLTYPSVGGRHRTAHAENRKTGETLGGWDFEHQEGWASDGANFTGVGAHDGWTTAVNRLATKGNR